MTGPRRIICLVFAAGLLFGSAARADQRSVLGAGFYNSFSGVHYLSIEAAPGLPALAHYSFGPLLHNIVELDCVIFSTSQTGFPQVQASGPDSNDPSLRFYILVIDRNDGIAPTGQGDVVEVQRVPADGPCGADVAGFEVGTGDFAVN